MEEVWKDIPDYEGYYQISTLGRVKSLSRKESVKLRIMKSCLDDRGYPMVGLIKNHKRSTRKVHALMRNAFFNIKGLQIDHINGIKIDNRLENLRLCTHQQNSFNVMKRPNTTSKYKGMYWNKKYKNWTVQIGFNGKRKHLGDFKIEEEGAKAYDKAALKFFGEFARLNFPEEI